MNLKIQSYKGKNISFLSLYFSAEMETNKRHEVSSDEVRELHRNVVFEKIDKCNKCEKVFANKRNLLTDRFSIS